MGPSPHPSPTSGDLLERFKTSRVEAFALTLTILSILPRQVYQYCVAAKFCFSLWMPSILLCSYMFGNLQSPCIYPFWLQSCSRSCGIILHGAALQGCIDVRTK